MISYILRPTCNQYSCTSFRTLVRLSGHASALNPFSLHLLFVLTRRLAVLACWLDVLMGGCMWLREGKWLVSVLLYKSLNAWSSG